jgi:glucosamine--fructose-6-phosphate aminotransferase (isomerizing)
MGLRTEIFQQPEVLRQLLESQRSHVKEIARELGSRDVKYIFLAARGTSDNAGLYLKYLFGSYNRLPIALAAPSLFSMYQQPPDLGSSLVLGISQSGKSPDIVSVLSEGRKQGVPTLAITNKTDSPLAEAAEYVIDIKAGKEKAVAATKTYTAQLLAVAMLSAALAGDDARFEALNQLADYAEKALALEPHIECIVERFYYMTLCVVLGRGYNYATAYEWALKLKELAYVVAEPYSSADFMHGPIAIVERGFPIMAVLPSGAVYQDLLAVVRKLKESYKAELLVISNRDEALELGSTQLRLPSDIPEWISPLVSIVPAQLFSYHLTRIKGFDTESPRGLKKVTETR